ncbi:VWD domain-containing protein [Nonomuraea sp. NPDC050663]|uniref:VWD domain-containing protein n=1 Tax=Nonomuraea sp. NPDC050663 TaxID=3364370 RepID=UPI0037BBA125
MKHFLRFATFHPAVFLVHVETGMRQFAACLMALMMAAVVAFQASPTFAETVDRIPLLATAAIEPRVSLGEYPSIAYTLTNRGDACAIATSPGLALQFTSVKRDGITVDPSVSRINLIDGYGAALTASSQTINTGESITLVLESADARSFEMIDSTDTGIATSALWPIDGKGQFEISLIYRAPFDSSQFCLTPKSLVTVNFEYAPHIAAPSTAGATPTKTQSTTEGPRLPIWLLIGGVGLILSLTIVLILLWRRAAAGALILLAPLALICSSGQRSAAADISPLSGTSSSYQECAANFNKSGGDPEGVFKRSSSDKDDRVILLPGRQGEQHFRRGAKDFRTIKWDTSPPERQMTFSDGVKAEKCATLYHELTHYDQLRSGKDDGRDCVESTPTGPLNTHIAIDEVEATRAENKYRVSQGLPQRTKYSGKKLPAGPCRPDTPKPSSCKQDGGCGGALGDPHMRTGDGHAYDFQGHGEFDILLDPDRPDDLRLQTRMTPYRGSTVVSVISAVGLSVAGTHLGFSIAGFDVPEVWRNGTLWSLQVGETTLPGDASITRTTNGAFIARWRDGTEIAVTARPWGYDVTVAVSPDRAGKLTGLLGNFNGDINDDLTSRTGQTFGLNIGFADLYGSFGDSWRIRQAESLFKYAEGESTDTFTDKTFPPQPTSAVGLPDQHEAEAICQAAGVTDPQVLKDCVLDVAVSGDPAFVDAAVTAQGSLGMHNLQLHTRAGPDILGGQDGRIAPDGFPDVVFDVVIEGEVVDLVLNVCRANGKPTGHHWDTIAGSRTIPPGFAFTTGNQTWTLAVYSGGQLVSGHDGSLQKTFEQSEAVRINVADDGSLRKGSFVCLTVFTGNNHSYRFMARLS